MTRQAYIHLYQEVVRRAVQGTGLFPSLMMAQALLESSDMHGTPGNSTLARVYNNHFGIKADGSWKGKSVNLITREVFEGKSVILGDYFRVYEKAEDSFFDRVAFLKHNPRYAKACVFTATTPQLQAEALQRAGYATNPAYASILSNLMERLNLFELDKST